MDPKTTVETIDRGIKTASEALDLYNRVLDQMIPWKTFAETIAELTRYQEQYSAQAAGLVSTIKTLLMDSQDAYYNATQSVYEWCGVSCQLLQAYLTLFENYNENKAAAQKGILVKTLGDGIIKLSAAQEQLAKSTSSFNGASGNLIALQNQLNSDFDSSSSYFEGKVSDLRKQAYGGAAAGIILGPFGLAISYSIAAGVVEGKLIPELKKKLAEVKNFFEDLGKTVKKADEDINEAKEKLQTEISDIGEIKIATEATAFYVEYDDLMLALLKDSAKELIRLCFEYQKRHGKKGIVPDGV